MYVHWACGEYRNSRLCPTTLAYQLPSSSTTAGFSPQPFLPNYPPTGQVCSPISLYNFSFISCFQIIVFARLFTVTFCNNSTRWLPERSSSTPIPVSATLTGRAKAHATNRIAGVDDVMAMLLALSASKEELEVIMISVTYGNVPLEW